MKKKITVLSLFDGIGCTRLALERVGIKVKQYYASETNPYARQITQGHYPDTIQLGAIEGISYKDGVLYTLDEKYDVGTIDLVVGASPLKCLSSSGAKQGIRTTTNIVVTTLEQYLDLKAKKVQFEGDGYLFWEYVRLLREINPRWFLFEGIRTANKSWIDVISGALGVQPVIFDNSLVSAHKRINLFWTNINKGVFVLPQGSNTVVRDILRGSDFGNPIYNLSVKHLEGFNRSYRWSPQSLDKKCKNILVSYAKRPPHCPYIPSRNSDSGYRMLSPVECERVQTLPDNYTEGISKYQRYAAIGNASCINALSHLLKEIPVKKG